MKYSLTDKILLFLADWFDFNSRWTWRNFSALPDDPRLHYHRRWVERCLEKEKEKRKIQNIFWNLKRREMLQKQVFKNSEGFVLFTIE